MNCRTTFAPLLLAALFLAPAGCGKKTKTEARPAADNKRPPKETTATGPHGGHKFHLAKGHDVVAEIKFTSEPRRVELYFLDHEDNTKGILAADEAITLSGLKHAGKDLADVTLKAAPLQGENGGSSHFEATGDAVPADVDEVQALNGATFTATIGGKSRKATVNAGEEEHDEHEDHKSKTR